MMTDMLITVHAGGLFVVITGIVILSLIAGYWLGVNSKS